MPKAKKEKQLDVIARHVAEMHRTMAKKNDVAEIVSRENKALEKRMDERFNEVDRQLMGKATKDGLRDLENKLIEDTGAVTGVEQKHYRSHVQRIARL